MKLCTLDIETTGLPPKGDDYENLFMNYPYILSMAWKINDSQTVEYKVNNRGIIVPEYITKINGITQKMVDESKWDLFAVMVQFIMDAHSSNFVIGHNIFFDTSIIKANILRLCLLSGMDKNLYTEVCMILNKDRRIDTCRASATLNNGKRMKLTDMYKLFFNSSFDAHSAGADVDATYKCYLELVKRGIIKVNI